MDRLCPAIAAQMKARAEADADLYDSLLERYGPREGPEIFARMAAERTGPFAPGAKYDLADPRVERKVERAGGVLPDPLKGRDDPPLA